MASRFGGDTRKFSGGKVCVQNLDPRHPLAVGPGRAPSLGLGEEKGELTPDTLLAQAEEEAGTPLCWYTFNLARRKVQVREWITAQMPR